MPLVPPAQVGSHELRLAALTVHVSCVCLQRTPSPASGSLGLLIKGGTTVLGPRAIIRSLLTLTTSAYGLMMTIMLAGTRSGHRCIINDSGDILVRPFPLELRLFLNLRGPACPCEFVTCVHVTLSCLRSRWMFGDQCPVAGGKLAQHYLSAYVKAFVAVCEAQFTAKRLNRCASVVLKLVLSPYCSCCLS